MINNFIKIINNKYSKLFKLFFFLRYIFSIFFISILLFLIIPKFFNYEKKLLVINKYLSESYNFKVNNYNSITYEIFPLPKVVIKNANIATNKYKINVIVKELILFLKIKNIYETSKFEAKNLLIKNSNFNYKINNFFDLIRYYQNINGRLKIENLDITLNKDDNSILDLNKINVSNYGLNKNKITGKIFDKKFLYSTSKKDRLDFQIQELGIDVNTIFENNLNENYRSGSIKINVLNTYFKSDFKITNDSIKIQKSNLRNDNLILISDGVIKFNPYFEITSNVIIEKFDSKILNNLKLQNLLINKEFIKRISSNVNIFYKSRKSKTIIKKHTSTVNFAHGRINLTTLVNIMGGEVNCKIDSLLTEKYPRMNFDCFLIIKDKKEIYKKLLLSNKFDNNDFKLNVIGSLNLLNNKINFQEILINKKKIDKEEDLIFFKEKFEEILFNESFFEIFKISKLKVFLKEII